MHSKLHYYSIGVVVKDSNRKEEPIEVWPVEIILGMDGELDGAPTQYKSNGIDAAGKKYQVEVNSSESLPCEWFGSTNRRTAPNVRAGESVLIYRVGDEDRFFWRCMGRTDELRRGERVVYTWSDIPEDDVEARADESNSYRLEINTFDGIVQFTTVDTNGESYTYDFTLNTKEDFFEFSDNVGNSLLLNSKDTLIRFINEAGTWLELNKENINASAPDSITVKAVNTIALACKDYLLNASESVTINTKAYTCTATDSVTIGTKTYTLTGDTVKVTAGAINMTGSIGLNGPVAIAGPLSCVPGAGGGGASISGGVTVTGGFNIDNITITGTINGIPVASGTWHKP